MGRLSGYHLTLYTLSLLKRRKQKRNKEGGRKAKALTIKYANWVKSCSLDLSTHFPPGHPQLPFLSLFTVYIDVTVPFLLTLWLLFSLLPFVMKATYLVDCDYKSHNVTLRD